MKTAIIKKSVKCPNFLAEPAWRTEEMLQKGGIMVRMSMSALLGAAIYSKKCHKRTLGEDMPFVLLQEKR